MAKAIKHGSNEAIYFNLMLEMLASEGFSENGVLSSFRNLFNRRQLANCRDAILISNVFLAILDNI